MVFSAFLFFIGEAVYRILCKGILLIVTLIFLILIIAVIRALILKPTSAKTASIDYPKDNRSMEYAKKLSKMIQCETISNRYDNDIAKFYKLHEVLEELYPSVHKKCEKHEMNGNLLFCLKGKGNAEPILLMSHQDVVEATGTWEQDPFSGLIKDGVIWGRGTVDTKGSLSCILQAVEELIDSGYEPEGDVYIASSCTEEFSGDGAPSIVAYLKHRRIKLAMLVDEGGMIIEEPLGGVKGLYAMVGVLEKGYGDIKFTARSNGGHASAPGRNTPLVRLGKFMTKMEKRNPFRKEFNPTVKEMFHRLAPNTGFGLRLVFANLWLFGPLFKRVMRRINSTGSALLQTTMAFTTAKGSNGLNVLPQEAYVTANMRFIPHQGTEESIELVTKFAKEYDLETEVIHKDYPRPVVDFKGEAFVKVEKAIEKLFPDVGVVPYVMTVGTDARFFSDICNNCIRFAPLYINKQQFASIHGLNENLNVEVLSKAVDFYKEIVYNM
ncbi:M20 family peptidase [Lachnoclostridium phytofermentans]|uniref:Peptidase M20 n=1 Tax=Lachnoclostridium phytofermentans (strain ATCC 700394 / DSM 18823 / ISDg) TaxID=357809 RepID=A9KIU9_LACP7|nr:M20 family peptidase [Lachnoclostridium phytofermentans]ABX43962.1 peptidase M20 [Lachnoclostridium phytofermentans ISDg]